MRAFLRRLLTEESGHMVIAATGLVGAAGAILLAVGVTGDTDVLVWIGGGVMAVAFLNGSIREHQLVDYEIFARLDELEGGSSES
ncbi:MAG: hypothetical protein V3S31_01500 [Dehalococcoidia bacterium]